MDPVNSYVEAFQAPQLTPPTDRRGGPDPTGRPPRGGRSPAGPTDRAGRAADARAGLGGTSAQMQQAAGSPPRTRSGAPRGPRGIAPLAPRVVFAPAASHPGRRRVEHDVAFFQHLEIRRSAPLPHTELIVK
jgi:hypothetical protein